MDAGLFLILLALLYVVKHIFDAILDFIKYNQPKHAKKNHQTF